MNEHQNTKSVGRSSDLTCELVAVESGMTDDCVLAINGSEYTWDPYRSAVPVREHWAQ